jgi:predicted TPR repeat methyltransferase
LASLCERLHGLDLSERAVQRARQRLPQAQFAVGDLSAALPWATPAGGKYDLVTACEVLYFFADVEATVQRMSALGKACFVSFFSPTARLVAEPLAGLPGLQRGWIYHDTCAWLWAFWRPGSAIEP